MAYQDWMADIRVGDVLVTPTGDLRVVRAVVKRPPYRPGLPPRVVVQLLTRHCSWTRRCSTTINGCDLGQRGFRPTGKRKRLTSRMDRRIARDLANPHRPEHQRLSCCAVEGLP